MPASTNRGRRADKSSIPLDAAKIRQLREATGMSQTEAARQARIPVQNWNDIEHGRRKNLTIEMLERVAKALGVSARDLLK